MTDEDITHMLGELVKEFDEKTKAFNCLNVKLERQKGLLGNVALAIECLLNDGLDRRNQTRFDDLLTGEEILNLLAERDSVKEELSRLRDQINKIAPHIEI
ncbi:MAG: hypothetical protein OXG25_07660 [Gammaproteobacteria bacterium]|nr:hypothetical protein [Gammaproteobacteria bacterium]